jgi:hypothetical protein
MTEVERSIININKCDHLESNGEIEIPFMPGNKLFPENANCAISKILTPDYIVKARQFRSINGYTLSKLISSGISSPTLDLG